MKPLECLLAAAAALAAPALHAAGFMPADILKIQTVSDPSFSPDGRTLVYSVTVADTGKDEETSDLWTVPLKGGTPTRISQTAHSEWQPVFGPGGAVYFLSDAGESVVPSMSLTFFDRSRSLPSASMRPGFSLPTGP